MHSSAGTFSVHFISVPFFAATIYLRILVSFFCAVFDRWRSFLPPLFCSEVFGAFGAFSLGFIAGTSSVRSFAFHRVFPCACSLGDFACALNPGISPCLLSGGFSCVF